MKSFRLEKIKGRLLLCKAYQHIVQTMFCYVLNILKSIRLMKQSNSGILTKRIVLQFCY